MRSPYSYLSAVFLFFHCVLKVFYDPTIIQHAGREKKKRNGNKPFPKPQQSERMTTAFGLGFHKYLHITQNRCENAKRKLIPENPLG